MKGFVRHLLSGVLHLLMFQLAIVSAAQSNGEGEAAGAATPEGRVQQQEFRPAFYARLEQLRKRISQRAETAERLRDVAKLEQIALKKASQGDPEASRYLRQTLELLSTGEDQEDDPLTRQYYLELRERLLARDSGPVSGSKTQPAFAAPDHPDIARFKKYFTGSGRVWLDVGLRRLGDYREMIQKTLDEESIPRELMYLPLIESLYDPKAVSKAGAKGLWQFMSATARRYGLRKSARVDEREDPARSTRAAAQYLKDLYRRFGDWSLALAAYNSGQQRIERLMRQTGGASFWKLSTTGLIPQETKNYVPAVLAVISLMRDPSAWSAISKPSAAPSRNQKTAEDRADGPLSSAELRMASEQVSVAVRKE